MHTQNEGADRGARRRLLSRLAWAGAAPLAALWPRWANAQTLAPTPACGRNQAPTESQMDGPYFKPRSPQRTSLLDAGLVGDRLVLSGLVVGMNCKPVRAALLDFWQADAAGEYDNKGFRLRGHLYTDADGAYRLETIRPGLYPGRTRHIHVKVQAPGGRILTTQLYFPDEPGNQDDFIFAPALVMALSRGTDTARFDFVVRTAA